MNYYGYGYSYDYVYPVRSYWAPRRPQIVTNTTNYTTNYIVTQPAPAPQPQPQHLLSVGGLITIL